MATKTSKTAKDVDDKTAVAKSTTVKKKTKVKTTASKSTTSVKKTTVKKVGQLSKVKSPKAATTNPTATPITKKEVKKKVVDPVDQDLDLDLDIDEFDDGIEFVSLEQAELEENSNDQDEIEQDEDLSVPKASKKIKESKKNKLDPNNLKDLNIEKEIVHYSPHRPLLSNTPSRSNDNNESNVTQISLNALNIEQYKIAPDEEYMNEKQINHIKNILEAWKQQLQDELDKTIEYMKEESVNYADEVDRASQETEFSLFLRNRDRERRLLNKIDKTLAKIAKNPLDFGYCENCGEEIGLRRLEARPTADYCIECKSKFEIQELQQKG